MYNPKSPDELTNEERLAEVAAILARGVIRLHSGRNARRISSAEPTDNSVANSLDVVPEMRLTVDSGNVAASSNEASRLGADNT